MVSYCLAGDVLLFKSPQAQMTLTDHLLCTVQALEKAPLSVPCALAWREGQL